MMQMIDPIRKKPRFSLIIQFVGFCFVLFCFVVCCFSFESDLRLNDLENLFDSGFVFVDDLVVFG